MDKRKTRMGGFYWVEEKPYLTVTTILRVIDKSGPLMYWACGETYDAVMKSIAEGNPLDRKSAIAAHKTTSKKAMNRGTIVHDIVEAWKNINEVVGQEGPYQGYAKAFKSWIDDYNPVIKECERTVFSNKYNYAGTLDMLAEIGGKLKIVDVKTGKNLYPEVQLQTAAYKQALSEDGVEVEEGTALLLKEDGTYKFETHTDKLPAFLAAKTLYEGINQKRLEKVGYLIDKS